MADTQQTPGADSIVEMGGLRLESSSLAPSSETPKETLERFVATQATTPASDVPGDSAPPAASDAAAPDADAAPPASDDPKPKKPSGMRIRHDELQARVHAATREVNQLREETAAEQRRLDALRTERQRLERGEQPPPADPKAATTTPPASTVPDDDPEPDWDTYQDQGKSFKEFNRDNAAWIKRQTLRDVEAAQAQRAEQDKARTQDEQDQRHQAMATQRVREMFQALSEDPAVAEALQSETFLEMPRTPFMSALIKLHEKGAEVLKHLALNPDDGYAFAALPPLTEPVMQAFRETADPVRLLAALANNEPEARRIATLSPYQAMKALAALESSAPDAKSGTSAAAPRQPKASPLPATLGSTHSVATRRPLHELGTDDIDEYYARTQAGESVQG